MDQKLVERLLSRAKRQDAAMEVSVSRGTEFSVEVRHGEIEHLLEASSSRAGIRVFVDQRAAVASSSGSASEPVRRSPLSRREDRARPNKRRRCLQAWRIACPVPRPRRRIRFRRPLLTARAPPATRPDTALAVARPYARIPPAAPIRVRKFRAPTFAPLATLICINTLAASATFSVIWLV